MAATFLFHMEPAKWAAWGDLLYSVQTGASAFDHVHQMDFFDYLAQHADLANVFQTAMTTNTARSGSTIVEAYPFTDIQRLVDVGGGQGLLLATILQAHPTMHGILFDRPEVMGAAETLAEAGVAERCEIVGGDFFKAVPAGGDAYLLRHIVHDWDDAHAITILKNCRSVLPSTGKVLVVERAIPADPKEALPILALDLEMLVTFAASERTEAEYRSLFAAADLRLSAVIPLDDFGSFCLFEAVPA
jgi:hypothetical protein